MKGLNELPESYYEKFANKKVTIKPFNPETRKLADVYIKSLNEILGEEIEVVLRGSTLFGIAGKGEIEYGVYPGEDNWQNVFDKLKVKYGDVQNTDNNYARFNDVSGDTEIEIIMMKGRDAEVDKKLTAYLLEHKDLLKEYEGIKYQNCGSKKDYMIAKDKFFRRVIEMIPED